MTGVWITQPALLFTAGGFSAPGRVGCSER